MAQMIRHFNLAISTVLLLCIIYGGVYVYPFTFFAQCQI